MEDPDRNNKFFSIPLSSLTHGLAVRDDIRGLWKDHMDSRKKWDILVQRSEKTQSLVNILL